MTTPLSRFLAVVALTAIGLLPNTACTGGATRTDQSSYRIDQPVTALVVDARAASVTIVAGDGPVTVTEKYHYSSGRPTTTHRVEGRALQLTESGCGDDDARCDVSYRIQMPGATSAEITARAGAVRLDGLAGDVHITTEAGAVEAHALSSDVVTIKTDAGAASLEFVEAPTLVRTTSSIGAVELRVPGSTAYAVEVHTEVGAVSVDVDKDPRSAHRIEVSTEVGGVKIDRLP
jgi:hypothetical protein